MKKFNNMIILVIITALYLLSCAKGDFGESSVSGKDADGALEVWLFLGGEKGSFLAQKIRNWGEENSIELKLTQLVNATDSDYQKIEIAVQSKTAPDLVIYFNRFLTPQWVENGYLMDISSYINDAEITGKEFYKSNWDDVNYKGKIYGLPIYSGIRFLNYNKKMLENADIAVPKTWDDLKAAAAKLTRKNEDGSYDILGFAPIGQGHWYYTYAFSAGVNFQDANGKFIFADQPAAIKTMDFYKYWFDTYNQDLAMEKTLAGFQQIGNDPFATGHLAMVIDGVWAFPNWKKANPNFEWGVAPVPYPEGGKSITWSAGHGMIIPKGAKRSDGAFALMKELSMGEMNKEYVQFVGYEPSVVKLANELYRDDARMQKILTMAATAAQMPPTPAGAAMWEGLINAQDEVAHGKKDSAQALKDLQNKINDLLDEMLE